MMTPEEIENDWKRKIEERIKRIEDKQKEQDKILLDYKKAHGR